MKFKNEEGKYFPIAEGWTPNKFEYQYFITAVNAQICYVRIGDWLPSSSIS